MMQTLNFDFDFTTFEQDIQNIAQEARKDAMLQIEQDIKFPEIIQVFHKVLQ